jgi:cell division protein FtsZ
VHQGMTAHSIGATALQAQPAHQAQPGRAPMLRDDMADLARFNAAKAVERQIDDRPFIAPPAVEPAARAPQPTAEIRVSQPAPQPAMLQPTMTQPAMQQPTMNQPLVPQAAMIQPTMQPLPQNQASAQPERKKAPTLFEKMTSRITGTASRPATQPMPAQAGSRPQGREAPQRSEPNFVQQPAQQTSLNLDPTDRIGGQRGEEEMLDIPAFLRRQAN